MLKHKIRAYGYLAVGLICLLARAATPDDNAVGLPTPSSSAQRLYASAKVDLLQLRSLLKNGRTQATVGSGFVVGDSNLVVTNYHVMSQIALEPETYVGEYVATDGARGPVQLLAVDVLHDLAVVRVDRSGHGVFSIPQELPQLTQGQYLYSLGNPLDLGFAISEGAYNGVISRSFYQQLMFTGPINAGMSGGPSVTVDRHVAGVNVSKRLDGELVSFLVPIEYVRDLLNKVATQSTPPKDFKLIVGQQLMQHQAMMVERLASTPFNVKALGEYRVPVWESDQMRCWGWSNAKQNKPYLIDQTNCAMEAGIFVSDQLQTGQVSIRHKLLRGHDLGPLQFSTLQVKNFKDQNFGGDKDLGFTSPQCVEQFVANQHLPMRAVLCVRAYRKFSDLYEFGLLTATTDASRMSLQTRVDVDGVSYANGLRLARLFLEAIRHEAAR
jgi:serine protease Do